MLLRNLGIFVLLLSLASCGGGNMITVQDMDKQEDQTLQAIQDARQESVELIKMKEEFSSQNRDRLLEKLAREAERLQEDINNLEEMGSEAAREGSASMMKELKESQREIEGKIAELKTRQKEDWSEEVQAINLALDNIKARIKKVTANLPEDKE